MTNMASDPILEVMDVVPDVRRNDGACGFIAFLVSALLALLVGLAPAMAYAANDGNSTSRAISIAYDNSGSMIQGQSETYDKWCTAKYSLEVLAGMLNQQDTLSVYTMDSAGEKLHIQGSDDVNQRVASVHNADLGVSGWTDARVVQEAYQSLLSSTADERYLVITTDGKFNSLNDNHDSASANAAISEVIDGCKSNGITVIYLAIGDDAGVIDSDTDHGIYVKLAASDNILGTMTETANQIFGRVALPDGSLDVANGKLTLDVPMSNLIVFAQGQDVQLGDLTTTDGKTVSADMANVRYSDRPTADTPSFANFLVNTELQGIIAAYSAEMPAGECGITIGNASSVEVYYTPYVDISVSLTETTTGMNHVLDPDGENQIEAGTYEVGYSFLDPFTGEPIQSDLLYPATFSLVAESGGNVQSLSEGDQLTVSPGQVDIIAHAKTRSGVTVSESYQGVSVSQALSILHVDGSSMGGSLSIPDFGSASYPVSITKDDGTDFTAEEWAALTVTVEDSSGVVWSVEKGDQPGAVTVAPSYINGSAWDTQSAVCSNWGLGSRSSDLTIRATAETSDRTYSGQDVQTITYLPDITAAVLHLLPVLIALTIILYFVYKYATKPRLPRKMKLAIQLPDGTEVPLKYNENKIVNRWSPWGPEHIHIVLIPKGMLTTWRIAGHFQLASIGFVAAKKRKGRRRFLLDTETVNAMKHLEDQEDGTYPKPRFNPSPQILEWSRERARKDGRVSLDISFDGLGDAAPGRRPQIEKYKITFMRK